MKAKKIIRGFLIFLLLLILLVVCTFLFWLGPTVKLLAERIGTRALGTPLKINELSINPRHGTFHMTGFSIANQDHFGRTNAISLASMDISLDVGSLFGSTVVVHRVLIESPHFVYEQDAAGDNITLFANNLQAFLGIDPNAPPPVEEEKATKQKKQDTAAGEPKVVMVEQLEINDIQFHLANTEDPQLDLLVGIDQLALSMTNGMINLRKFHVGNPARMQTPDLFTLEKISFDIDPASIYSGTVSVRDAQVVRPYVYLERNPETDTVTEFLRIAASFTPASTNSPASPPDTPPAEPGPEESTESVQPLMLHNLVVDDIQIKLFDAVSTNATDGPGMLAGIGSITARLVDGTIRIEGISVPNPEGFRDENLFHLETIDVSLDPTTLFSKQLIIENIFLTTPRIAIEQQEDRGNFSELQRELMAFVPASEITSPADAAAAPTPEQSGMTDVTTAPVPLSEQPVILHGLDVTNFCITLRLPAGTNSTGVLRQGLSSLNSMEKDVIGKLNPLSKGAKTSGTNEAADADSPLRLVSFDLLHAAPMAGTLTIHNLAVANVRGFANDHLVTIQQFVLDLDPDTLQSDLLVVEEILIDRPRVAYERQLSTDNIKALQATIEQAMTKRRQYTDAESEAPVPAGTVPPAGSSAAAAPAQKVVISHILVKDGLVRAKLSALPTAPIPLPSIELWDIGKTEGGASVGQAMSKIGNTFYDAILKSVSGTTGFAVDALKGAGQLTLGTLESVTGVGSKKSGVTPGDAAIEKVPQASAAAEGENTRRKGTNPIHRRRPGRTF